jgi:hypothetical protein
MLMLPGAPRAESDSELEHVVDVLRKADPDGQKMARAVRRTFDMLLDGQHTKRFRWDQLHKTEKTHAGTLVEINLQREFGFADGLSMDYSIDGIDVDCKYSQSFGKWMIPPEAMGHICLGLWANDQAGLWSAGLFRVTRDILTAGDNRDSKRTMTAEARDSAIRWLHRDAQLPENVLLRLPQEVIDKIFGHQYGTQRVNELFRLAQRRLISRTAVATVANQEDYMKRVRGNGGARTSLRREGIVIFGQYLAHTSLAVQLGLPAPGAGEFVSVRLAPTDRCSPSAPHIHLEDRNWILAGPADPVVDAPVLPEPRRGSDGEQ